MGVHENGPRRVKHNDRRGPSLPGGKRLPANAGEAMVTALLRPARRESIGGVFARMRQRD